MSRINSVALFLSFVLFPASLVSAQIGGLRGGIEHGGIGHGGVPMKGSNGLATLEPDVAQSYITVDGQVEIRVKPTEIRLVLAVTSEGQTAAACAQSVNETIKRLTDQWSRSGIGRNDIVEDFIAVLPRYEFEVQTVRDREVAVEKRSGYLMQTNLHVAVKDDAGAMKAINIAFANGVSDVIAVDYWSKELDQLRTKARTDALKAAREKSDVLLALFESRPPIINVQESTHVHYPESLYTSFTNASAAEYQSSYSRRDIPQIRTFRPKNTYYRGLYLDGDVQPKELPMQSEISVVSTVRLYFQSPVAKDYWSAKQQGLPLRNQ